MLLNEMFTVEDEIIHGQDHTHQIANRFSRNRFVSSLIQEFSISINALVGEDGGV